MDELVFTPASLADLLSQIDELKEYDISITQTIGGSVELSIGDSTYTISDDSATEVEVEPEVVDEVNEVNMEAYDELGNGEFDVSKEPVESGPIKEVLKTLLIGGMVRLAAKTLKN